MVEVAQEGTFACRICGQATPHYHSPEEVAFHNEIEALADESLDRFRSIEELMEALTTAQAQAAAQEQRIAGLEADVVRLKAMLGEVREAEKNDPLAGIDELPYIQKIKTVRARTGLSLTEARALVDRAALGEQQ